jgi:hypothetical protein
MARSLTTPTTEAVYGPQIERVESAPGLKDAAEAPRPEARSR